MTVAVASRSLSVVRAGLALAGCLLISTGASAQVENWPTRPIRIVTPTEAGGLTDYLPRALGQIITAKTKQPVIVDNKPGANTVIATEAVKNAAPDGYTFLVNSTSSHSANPALNPKLSYDPAKDFVDVGMFMTFPWTAVVRKESPLTSPRQLIAEAKANPGKLNCGVSAIASRVGCELLKKRAGLDFQIITFKSGAAALNAVAGGVVDFVITDSGSAATAIHGGLLRAIGVTSAARVPLYPDAPTFAEALPGFVYEGWAGLAAPAGTPKAIVDKMNLHLRQALAEPEFKKGIESRGGTIRLMTASEQADWVLADRQRWKDWVKQVDLKVE